jgi:hypothetical protein
MNLINRIRIAGGIPAKTITNISESTVIEAATVPRSRDKLEPASKENHQSRIASVIEAIEHLKAAAKVLKGVPAFDFNGDIPHYVREITQMIGSAKQGGLEEYLETLQQTHSRKFGVENEEQDLPEPPTYSKPSRRDLSRFGVENEEQDLPEPPPIPANLPIKPTNRLVPPINNTYSKPSRRDLSRFGVENEEQDLPEPPTYSKPSRRDLSRFGVENEEEDPFDDIDAPGDEFDPEDRFNPNRNSRRGHQFSKHDEFDSGNIHRHNWGEEEDEEYEDTDLGPEGATTPQSNQEEEDISYMGEAKKPCVGCDELMAKKKKKPLKESSGTYSNETFPLSWGFNSGPVNVIDTKKQGTLFNPPKLAPAEEKYEKITVPASIKKSLKDAIAQAEKDMSGFATTDRANVGFYQDVVKYFNTILDALNSGEPCAIKSAQTYYTTVMGPIQYKLPDDVTLFLAGGGQKRSLKDLFHQVKVD